MLPVFCFFHGNSAGGASAPVTGSGSSEDSGDGRFSSSSCSGSRNRTRPATHKNGHDTAHSGDMRRKLQQLSSDERRRRRCFMTMWGDSSYK
ncbi:hypothetical protein MRB53_009612 [Persea americana]|uniref:Uncharacterized protein n=1 Tax=Persea americana TaxID=3435 RepID=A0ACC2LPV2_PERAE|nr:hypothetical protein MRB53_009612 [Persea americana]